MENIIDYITKTEALIAAIVALVLAAIAGYKAITDAIKNAAKIKLTEAAVPLIGQAEETPIALANTLVNKPEMSHLIAESNNGKRDIVAQALIEREPKLLKKLKLKDIISVGGFVSSVYQTIAKPLIKGLKK